MKLLIIIFIALAVMCRTQHIEIRCRFSEGFEYSCTDTVFVITQNATRTVAFVGDHVTGQSNTDVVAINWRHPPLPYFLSEVFSTFPNLGRMLLFFSTDVHIGGGAFENARHLQSLGISNNHLVVLSDYALTGAANVTYIEISDCESLRIDEFAFSGLRSLNFLLIWRSNLQIIAENSFSSLINLERFDLRESRVETIPSKLFANNSQLRRVFMDMNPINQIGRSFIDNLEQLESLDLRSSNCVDNWWSNVGENREEIHRTLDLCYRNYDELPRNFTLELQGSLVIRDRSGNVLVRL